MTYLELLKKTAKRNKSIVCLGMDPDLEKIPLKGEVQEVITTFFCEILDATYDRIGAVKPNYAFYAQYGFEGLHALKDVIEYAHKKKLPVILDGKRGDIGKSSDAYAREMYDFWKADAVTVSPYMGRDSIEPFIRKGKGVYLLARTSNPGSADLQQLHTDKGKLYDAALELARQLQIGAVVGATDTLQLKEIASRYSIPLLIPGVGTQGGSAQETAAALQGDISIHRINSSSGITYGSNKYAQSAREKIDALNREINV